MRSFKLLRKVRISSWLSFKEMSFGKKGVFCLQSTQTQTFSVVTCLARASRLLCNSITVTGPPKPPRRRAAGQWRGYSSRRGRGRRRSGGQPGWRRDVGGAGTRSTAEMKGEAGSAQRPGKPKQEGHIWGSMRRTAFILGSGLLLLVAFWNSVTWHLQRFWGASGYFWQAQWERLLSTFEGKEWTLYIIGATQVPSLLFWSFNGLLLVVDTTGKPHFISRYRIQVGKNEPMDAEKLRQSIRTVLFNQWVISLPMLVFLYPILKLWGDPCRRELPTFHWFLLELAIFTLIEEVLFYYSHRLLHHPTFYRKIHKKHHEWTAPIGVISLYAHPIEHVVSNMLPVMVGPIVMGSHLSSITMWFSLALIITTISHCGYHLPFLPSPEFHDYHHLKFNQCYGVLGVLDHLHGTDTVFKQTKAYERHILLLGFTPLSESIPDAPKKTE